MAMLFMFELRLIATFEIIFNSINLIMFLDYLPSGMSEVIGITMVFAFLVGVILTAMFTTDKGNTKNLYTKTTR
tara:strand:- start:82 stop:303 length:222 start_codon:yes stop_codon:yes gene_type:complete